MSFRLELAPTIPGIPVPGIPVPVPGIPVPGFPGILPPVLPPLLPSSVQTSYSTLFPPIYPHTDINNDYAMRKKIIDYFYDAIDDVWIKLYFYKILKLLKVVNGKVEIIKSYNQETSSDDDYKLKHAYLLNNVLTKKRIGKLINSFRKINNINWWDVKKNQNKFAKFIYLKLKIYFDKKIKE